MSSSARRRPRTASVVSSVSRRASRSNCSSLSIADLQVGDRFGGVVEDPLDGGAVDMTAELADAGGEAGEGCLERRIGLEHGACPVLDPLQRLPLIGEQTSAARSHPVAGFAL